MEFVEPIYLQVLVEMPPHGLNSEFLKNLEAAGFRLTEMDKGADYHTMLLFTGNKPYLPNDPHHKTKICDDVKVLMEIVPEIEKVYVINKRGRAEI
jgi:hypothetical protein